MKTLIVLGAIAIALRPLAASADGPGAYRPRERPPQPVVSFTAELEAIDAYNAGYALIQRAEHHENLAAASVREEERARASAQARDAYAASLERFAEAVRLDPTLHEAYTYAGFANRKLGRHERALEAYARALELNPDYPHAIEYQGEAFLGLGRVADARRNYLRLYALHRGLAHKLLRAIDAWAAEHTANPPRDVDIEELKSWIAERERSHDPNDFTASW